MKGRASIRRPAHRWGKQRCITRSESQPQRPAANITSVTKQLQRALKNSSDVSAAGAAWGLSERVVYVIIILHRQHAPIIIPTELGMRELLSVPIFGPASEVN